MPPTIPANVASFGTREGQIVDRNTGKTYKPKFQHSFRFACLQGNAVKVGNILSKDAQTGFAASVNSLLKSERYFLHPLIVPICKNFEKYLVANGAESRVCQHFAAQQKKT